jgi:Baseplate J-like protein
MTPIKYLEYKAPEMANMVLMKIPTHTAEATIFAVYSDGAVQTQQDNLPEIKIAALSETRFSWTVVSTDGFSGQPSFWVTHPAPSDTSVARLHWSGIDNQDWEFGREGTVTIEATPANGLKQVITVTVAVRSIDQKNLTFFTPSNIQTITTCKGPAFSPSSYTFSLTPPSALEGFSLSPSKSDSAGSAFQVKPDNSVAAFHRPVDTWFTLNITDGVSQSSLRLRVSTRPLRFVETKEFFGGEELLMIYGRPSEISIDGEPSSSAGFDWNVEDFDPSGFKLEPVFEAIGRTKKAALQLEGLSDWDWIYGTVGKATLVINDGRRAPTRLPFNFRLEQVSRKINLDQGTSLRSSGGERYEIAQDGEYAPVIDTSDPDNPIIRLEGVQIRSVDAGAGGNMSAGQTLTFPEKQPLIGEAVVGSTGINMGDDDETDAELRDRVSVLWADPPGHGNRAHVLQIAGQVAGVDRAFVYSPFALEGFQALGKVGVALVAPGRRSGVGADSALAREVYDHLLDKGSLTADYVMMDVDDYGVPDPATGRGSCQVDVELQLQLEDESRWSFPASRNLIVASMPQPDKLIFECNRDDPEELAQVSAAVGAIEDGRTMQLLGSTVTVQSVVDAELTVYLTEPLMDDDGNEVPVDRIIGQRFYPICPVKSLVEDRLDAVFKALGTSESPNPGDDVPWQRRYPLTSSIHPAQLRVAEIVNQIMEIEGVRDMRVVTPIDNVAPPPNEVVPLLSGEKFYKTYILSLRRVAVGPMRYTPGVDPAPTV